MYKATDLRERTLEDLKELEKTVSKEIFASRFKNFTNRLDDTSALRKHRRDLARIKTVLAEKLRGAPAPAKAAPKAESPQKSAAPKKEAAPAAEKKTRTKKATKKDES